MAAHQHRCAFMRTCAQHPPGALVRPADILGIQAVFHLVVELSSEAPNLGYVSRTVFGVCRELSRQFRWRFGFGYCARTLQRHSNGVTLARIV